MPRVIKQNKWLVPCNPKNVDIEKHFLQGTTVYVKRNRQLKIGDMVYLYLSKPYSQIMYRGIVIESRIDGKTLGDEFTVKNEYDRRVLGIKLERKYPEGTFTRVELFANGLGQVVNQQLIRYGLADFIATKESALERKG